MQCAVATTWSWLTALDNPHWIWLTALTAAAHYVIVQMPCRCSAIHDGSLDSMERGTVEWNSGTMEWNSGMVERWNSGMVDRAINDPVPFLLV